MCVKDFERYGKGATCVIVIMEAEQYGLVVRDARKAVCSSEHPAL